MQHADRIVAALGAGVTRRFHTFHLNSPQDVAAHSWQVAMLCDALSEGKPSVALLQAAIRHDIGEHWTGDVPSPVKRSTPEIESHLDALEAAETLKHTGLGVPYLTPPESWILKSADYLSGLYHCLVEKRLGNTTLRQCFDAYAKGCLAFEVLMHSAERWESAQIAQGIRELIELEYNK
jgi:5'-deoxynucleotidase YfbR-like HD superfamily hydrolase